MEITLKEIMTKLQNLKKSGDLSVDELAKALNLKLVTEEMTNDITLLSNLKKELGEGDPMKIMKSLKTDAGRIHEVEFVKIKDKAMDEVFKNETLKKHAESLFNLKAGNLEDCQKEVTRISELEIMKEYASALAGDMSKNVNLKINTQDNKNDSDEVVEL